MKKIMAVLLVILLCIISGCMADEIPEETIIQLKERCYINPNGGNKLHVDQNCESVNPRYLPLTEIEFNETLLNQYSVCPVCTAVGQPQHEPSPLDQATKVMSEEEIYRITVEWEKKYSFSELWNYQVNAAFSAETRTIPYNPYVFDFSLLPVMPDEDAIPAEKIAEDAVSLAVSYGSSLTEKDLENMQVIVSQYVKPDKDVYLFSTNGSWLVNFWKDDENFACLYVDAHTGIPNFFYLIQDGIQYIGEPGVEPRID